MWQCINLGELCDIWNEWVILSLSLSLSLYLPLSPSRSLSLTHTCNGTHRIKLKGKMCILTDPRANIRYCCIRILKYSRGKDRKQDERVRGGERHAAKGWVEPGSAAARTKTQYMGRPLYQLS